MDGVVDCTHTNPEREIHSEQMIVGWSDDWVAGTGYNRTNLVIATLV